MVPGHERASARESGCGHQSRGGGADLFALLELCRELHALTAGAFDPASTALSRAWGFLERKPRLPSDTAIEDARPRSGMDKVELDSATRSVRFSVPVWK